MNLGAAEIQATVTGFGRSHRRCLSTLIVVVVPTDAFSGHGFAEPLSRATLIGVFSN